MSRKLVIPVFIAAVLLLCLFAWSGAAGAANTRATLAGTAPAWANAKNYRSAADPSTVIGFRVYLSWQNGAAAEALAKAVSDPKSSSYGKYLSPVEFRKQFAPSQEQVGSVQSWLRAQGFSVDYTPANNHYVAAEGTLAQAGAAFGTSFGIYTVNGQSVRSPAADVSIPSALAGLVTSVVGLDESAQFVVPDHVVDKSAPPSPGYRNAPPLSDYYGQVPSPYTFPAGFRDAGRGAVPWAVKGYTPAQIKGAYGITSGDGAGQTVAIIDAYASPTILADVNTWSTRRGLPTMTAGQLVQVVAPGTYKRAENKKQDPQGWWGEETLDVEAVHGMAPAAKIVFVGSPNNYQDMDAAMNHVVDLRLADIVSNSYGWNTELLPKGFIKPLNDTFVQAVIEGIGVYFSSGDDGDESTVVGYSTVDWPACSPWVTAVGGTSLAIGANNKRIFETGWGTSSYSADPATLKVTDPEWLYGAGGGVSRIFAKPWYQSSLSVSGRGVPDVAALADPQTGFLMGQTQTFSDGAYYDEYRIGGTSLACPIYAGLMALAQQKAGTSLGFANPLFYASVNAGSFTDITPFKSATARRNFVNGENATDGTVDLVRTFDDYSGSPTQKTAVGWDDVTGLGVPKSVFQNLVK